MYHGHVGGGDGGVGPSGIFWFLYVCGSLVVAYFVMKVVADRRESHEKSAKQSEKRRKRYELQSRDAAND